MPLGNAPPAQDPLLRFKDDHLEDQFRAELATQGRSIRIAALGFAVVLILTMGWLDPLFLDPDVLRLELIIRYAALAPIPGVGMLLIWRAESAGRRYQPFMAALAMGIGLVFSVQLGLGGASASQYYFPAIIMGLLFGQFLVGLPFVFSLPVTLTTILLYCAVCVAVGTGAGTLIYVAVMLAAIGGISTYAAYQFEHAMRSSFVTARALGAERDQYDALLGQILPDSVRARLSAGEGNVAETHAEVTVMFIDLVGFSDLSRRLTAPHLVEVLDIVFKRLDELSDEHGVERIKTIGDCYMCAAGLDADTAATGPSVLDMALKATEAVVSIGRDQDLALAVRVGIATGTAVSGVLGSKRPHFDLWGETVNLASRMQVTGVADRVHVDERTRHRYRAQFQFEARGEVEIRGMGTAETYFLLNRHAAREGAAAS